MHYYRPYDSCSDRFSCALPVRLYIDLQNLPTLHLWQN
eukprot:UN18956